MTPKEATTKKKAWRRAKKKPVIRKYKCKDCGKKLCGKELEGCISCACDLCNDCIVVDEYCCECWRNSADGT